MPSVNEVFRIELASGVLPGDTLPAANQRDHLDLIAML
jgi:hypothetical protein